MDRYLQMQTLHTRTLNALTAESKGFNVELVGDQAAAADRSEFDRNMAEAVAGEMLIYVK